jgi:hypothetical protein
MIYNKNKNSLETAFLVVAFLETAFLGKKIPWSVVQPFFSERLLYRLTNFSGDLACTRGAVGA